MEGKSKEVYRGRKWKMNEEGKELGSRKDEMMENYERKG
jgi:hypothetical protein